jgi:hypothetical protein
LNGWIYIPFIQKLLDLLIIQITNSVQFSATERIATLTNIIR